MKFAIPVIALIIALSSSWAEAEYFTARRSNPAHTDFGYVLYPIVAKAPGLNWSYGAGLMINNMFNTDTRLMFYGVTGSIKGLGLNFVNIDLWPEYLHLDMSLYDATTPRKMYDRGMNTSHTSFNTEMNHEYGGALGLTLNLFEKRLVLHSRFGSTKYQIQKVIQQDGVEFTNIDQDQYANSYTRNGIRLDLTDDWTDPHEGFRAEANRQDFNIFDPRRSKYHNWNYSATAYVPVLASSTWAFNYHRSVSYVTETSYASASELQTSIGLSCGQYVDLAVRAQCQEAEDRRVQNRQIENRYGNAGYLGGTERLRSFSVRRFQGSETLFYGTEFRWNMNSEKSPIDLGFIKGTRSGLQVAVFYESGSVSDPPIDIYNAPLQTTYGMGIRMILSGGVLRADVAQGSEGNELILYFGYPWGNTFL